MSQRLSADIEIPKKNLNENALDYAIRLADWYTRTRDLDKRKSKGQFFTPKEVSIFMANLFKIDRNTISVLDAGAGVGTLSAALCYRLSNFSKGTTMNIDAYENDPDLVPLLRGVLEACRSELEGKGHNLTFNVHEQDFILHNERYFKEIGIQALLGEHAFYDYVISNPPYYKLPRDSCQAKIMRNFISGHPNIYALFMALSAKMLKPNGEMVFITPRSFCSGFYYKKFREWFLKLICIEHIHIFESRKDIFDKDDVLQENVIIKAEKSQKTDDRIRVSTSKSKLFENMHEIEVTSKDIIFHKNGDTFIRIPTSQHDVRTLRLIDSWPNTLRDLGFEISTGPVVVFRTRQNLQDKPREVRDIAPLLWMHNLKDMRVQWPMEKSRKPLAIVVNDHTKPLLLPVRNYVLLKRFSSKEQRRRLYAAVLLKDDFPYDFVGIENHVNYIHKINGELTIPEAYGVAGLLDTTLIDNFFRSLNGNTQVNATDIRSLPMPDLQEVRRIGERIKSADGRDCDEIVTGVLGIDKVMEIQGEYINE